VVAKRPDGYHDIETVFYPLPFRDILELITAPDRVFSFTSSGLSMNVQHTNNLCVKAYQLLANDFPQLPPVKMHLHKTIPHGAGLGGGSADAAFAITMANRKFQLNLSPEQLSAYALQLGSDCPFFILNRPCYATGRGEQIRPIEISLAGYRIVLVNPGIHIPTVQAFGAVRPARPPKALPSVLSQPLGSWKQELTNDFEQVIFQQHPVIAGIKNELYGLGALYASMSGSGSTVYGIFPADANPLLAFPAHYLVKILSGEL
jgi:4-diphosphocytidyl-2-C-methyl-D-erythritol kinase